jgi:uncharacterized protein (DUF983 family)
VNQAPQGATPSPARAIWRGVRHHCPQCDAPTLFRAYLKLAPTCPACGADFTGVETADIAPYVTVFIVGLVTGPTMLQIEAHTTIPQAALIPSSVAIVVIAALLILPRAKGGLAGLFWQMRRSGAT